MIVCVDHSSRTWDDQSHDGSLPGSAVDGVVPALCSATPTRGVRPVRHSPNRRTRLLQSVYRELGAGALPRSASGPMAFIDRPAAVVSGPAALGLSAMLGLPAVQQALLELPAWLRTPDL